MDAAEKERTRRAVWSVRHVLGKRPAGEWVTGADLRRSLSSTVRPLAADALAALDVCGDVETRPIEYHGQRGWRYRLTDPHLI